MSKKAWIGVTIAAVAAALVIGTQMYVNRLAEAEVNRAIGRMSTVADISYRDVRVDLFGKKTCIRDVVVAPKNDPRKAVIDQVIVYDMDAAQEPPAFAHAAMKGLAIPLADMGEDARVLRDLGYQRITANMEIDYAYDPEKKVFHLKALESGADDMGSVHFSFRVGNFDMSSASNPLALLFALPQMEIHHAALSYRDASLTRRILKKAAGGDGADEARFLAELNRELDREIAGARDAFTREAIKAVKRFLNDPKEIALTMAPPEPVSIGSLQNARDPGDLIRMLHITVTP